MIGKTISHYHILEELGRGGMGVVYKAEDTKLKRKVALKFLPPGLTSDPEAKERFIREAQAASSLDHPNVCTIHEIGETPGESGEGQLFIVMACYEGETLKEKISNIPLSLHQLADPRLRRATPSKRETEGSSLPIDEATDIAVQIAEGLAKAHEKGIVHRDIKPANILITNDGVVKILDFGLAKLAGQAQLTKDSSTLGTVAYMSPEQLTGKDVDEHTDIWSLGIVLYEMLVGQSPFKGDYEQAIIYSIINEEYKPVSQTRKDIPQIIEQIITKSLEKNPEQRYENVNIIISEFKKPFFERVQSDKTKKSIIVLPFANMSPDQEQEYFSDGLTEEIITDLSHINEMRVISRTSSMMLKGTKKDIKIIGEELSVQYVLEGSVRKAGNNLRITAQLIDSRTDAHLWAEKYSGTLDDVFDIQEKVSRSIVDALKLKLSPEETKKIAERPIENVQAYEFYLKADADIFKSSVDAVNHALRYLQNAIDIVGDNALLYSEMAFACWHLVNIGAEQEDYLVKAEQYAKKALLLDPESSRANAVLGFFDFFSEKTRDVSHYKRALEVNKDEVLALTGILNVYSLTGKISAAIPYYEKFMQIDPLSVSVNWHRGGLFYYDGRFNLALKGWRRFYELFPENLWSQFQYALILAYHNETDEAISIIDQNSRVNPGTALANLGQILKYAMIGNKERVFKVITPDLQKTAYRNPFFSHFLGSFFAIIDEKTEALNWLENAVNKGFINYPFLTEHDPFLINIRGEQRFKKLMERVKFEWENFKV